jgi:hypothetical protein
MSAQFDVPVSITLTYGDAVVTLPTIE